MENADEHDGREVELGTTGQLPLQLYVSKGGDKLAEVLVPLKLSSGNKLLDKDNLSRVEVTVTGVSPVKLVLLASKHTSEKMVLVRTGAEPAVSLTSISSSEELSIELLSIKPESLSSSSRKSLSSSLSTSSSRSLSSDTPQVASTGKR